MILVLIMVFTGCSSNELKLYDSFQKTQEVTSMESDMAFSFTIGGEGFSEKEQADLQNVANMLNSTKMNIHQKMVRNKENTAARALADTKVNLGGISMDMGVWVDVDMSGENPKLVEIIKMPPFVMASMPAGYNNKEYIIYDFQKIMDGNQENININKLLKFSKEMQPKFTKLIKDSKTEFNPGFEIVKCNNKKVIDGKELTIYEVKLDDAAFKKLLRYTANYYMDNKDIAEFVKEYIKLVMEMTKPKTEEEKLAQDEIKKELENAEKELPSIKEEFNTFMDAYKDVKILGDKGIAIEYGVDSDGYIVHEAGSVDLRIDLGALGKSKEKGILKFSIEYNTKVYNINSDMKVDLPVIDENNSFNIMDMINGTMNQQKLEPTGSIGAPIEVPASVEPIKPTK